MLKLLRRLPAFALNGAAVALGIGLIQLLIGSLAGAHAAQLALSGAVCASLADVPNTVPRTVQRVAAAGALSLFAAIVVTVLAPFPHALGAGIGLVTFIAMMTMAWGARAGPVSFAPILSLVFSMAARPDGATLAAVATWHAVGSVAYLGWSVASGAVLQRRYRTLMLSGTLRAVARLLRARADLLATAPVDAADSGAMQAWVAGEAALAESLQNARDFVFAAPDSPRNRRDTAILLRAIDLRDVLLASRLDLDLLGADAGGRWLLEHVAGGLRRIGDALDAAALGLRGAGELHENELFAQGGLQHLFDDAPMLADDPRRRLLPALTDRLRRLCSDVSRIQAMLHGQAEVVPLSLEELRRFVAPEGWPLAALKAQASWRSPVLRHALRAALALACAYYIGLALPWASHPHWLVLSVAVVLRGNLEQTLARRNARVAGTLLGCVVVVGLSGLHSLRTLELVFLAAVGTAHAFAVQRYWLTATAGTVMALLQSHMVDPAGGFAIGERVADTVLGAALAWGFSYVLPSWERRHLPQTIATVLNEIRDYAHHALVLRSADPIAQRLARRRAYDALSAMAAALQRSAAEPRYVQVPVREVAAVLDRGQRLMAHLSLVRMIVTDRGPEWDSTAAVQALAEAHAVLDAQLDPDRLPPVAATSDAASADEVDGLSLVPLENPADDVMGWLQRRLSVLVHDARMTRQASQVALQHLKPT